MRNIIPLICSVLMATSLIQAQNATNDVYVINPSNGDGNLIQIEMRYQADPDAFYLIDNVNNPVESITGYLTDKPCVNLHLYVPATSESLLFNDFTLTSGNINEYRDFFVQWNEKVSGKIIIHSLSLHETGSTPDLIKKLSSLTGVPVEIVRYY